jgi:hypothetical protein
MNRFPKRNDNLAVTWLVLFPVATEVLDGVKFRSRGREPFHALDFQRKSLIRRRP